MGEKVLIRSKKHNTKIIALIFVIIGIISFICVWNTCVNSSDFYSEMIEEGRWNYVLTSMVPYFGSMTLLPFLILAGILLWWTSKIDMTVTDKRVYGFAAFGKRVDLPLDSVTAIGMGMFDSIAVSTASGSIKFAMISNKEDIHKVISGLLIERQDNKNNNSNTTQNVNLSNADELQKYKILLDNGTITQEEFEVKKKQLLGL